MFFSQFEPLNNNYSIYYGRKPPSSTEALRGEREREREREKTECAGIMERGKKASLPSTFPKIPVPSPFSSPVLQDIHCFCLLSIPLGKSPRNLCERREVQLGALFYPCHWKKHWHCFCMYNLLHNYIYYCKPGS